MQARTFALPALATALLALASCSSGGGAASATAPSCDDGSGTNAGSQAFCVVACNLGCGAVGCSITEIAQNQPITFVFNRPVDPSSVSFASIQIKTETGEEPVGSFLVNGDKVTFAPEVQVVGNSSFFGFKNGATYSLLIRKGGAGVPTVRSDSGQPPSRDVLCNLRVSRGIVDLDGAPPRATLVTPTQASDVSRDTRIVLEFSEILDRAPFRGSLADLPVKFDVRRTVLNGSTRECDLSDKVALRGSVRLDQDTARQISILTLVPGDRLPSDACIEIQVTTAVRDVAGTSARPQVFRFLVEHTPPVARTLVEEFLSQQNLDSDRSAGEWSGGVVSPAQVGGSGRHGEFDLSLLESLGGGSYLWDLDRDELNGNRGFLVPAARTLTGEDEFVADGEFHFSRLVVPANTTVQVVGSSPLRLFVRGRCEIQGTLDLRGASATPNFPARPDVAVDLPGQAASVGGPGGGDGGSGGSLEHDMGTPANPNKALFDGQPGAAGWVDAQHGYLAQAMARGGGGSRQWPTSGLNSSIQFTYLGVVSLMAPSPGGGGGFLRAGGAGVNSSEPIVVRQADSAGGGALDVTALDPLGRTSLQHFLLGGAGGGGGGAHTYFRALGESLLWCAGGAGGGGGGALLLRVGREMVTGPAAVIDVSGGAGADVTTSTPLRLGPATPGGGGSGGSVLMQAGTDYSLEGRVRALGGAGGSLDFALGGNFDHITLDGGDGSDGYIRVEAPTAPSLGNVGDLDPPATAANVGTLTDRDQVVALQSVFLNLSDVFPPNWTGYELEADVDNVPVVYSDNPSLGGGQRAVPFQTAVGLVAQAGKDDAGTIVPAGPWRQFVGAFGGTAGSVTEDGAVSIRFQLVLDYRRASTIVVRKLTFHYEN
ncbi:MAG: Ig-like domain-containing protein [Planctomycetota bacterium]